MTEREDALAKALCLLDTFAGEGLGHVYGNGQTIDADTTVLELAAAFGVEAEPDWWRKLAATLTADDRERRPDGPAVPGDGRSIDGVLHIWRAAGWHPLSPFDATERLREALQDAERLESIGVMVKCADLRAVLAEPRK